MEIENTEMEIEEVSEAPVQIVIDAAQYEALVGIAEQTKQEIQRGNEQLYSVWLLLAVLVIFESRRVISGVAQKLRKVRK